MSFDAFFLSRSPEGLRSLSSMFRERYACDVYVCTDYNALRSRIAASCSAAVVVDLHPDSIVDDFCECRALLTSDEAKVPVIAVCGEQLPRSAVAFAEADVVGRIGRYATIEEIDSLVESLSPFCESNSDRTGAYCVTAGDIQLLTYTPEVATIIERLTKIAAHDVPLLLVGETGTGKTTVAKLIHSLSTRREGPFQNVASGALPADLIESELFGHVRGAFTGADRNKVGRFEAAAGGTLLLDEIDVLAPKEQAKLLRVIETGEYEQVGSTETRCSNARLVVASNVDLKTLTEKQAFRSDLYYRLNVVEFCLPPLRDRRRDIVPLAMRFADDFCKSHNISIDLVDQDFVDALQAYHWPGNLRELKNHVQRAVLFCEGGVLTAANLPAAAGGIPEPRTTVAGEPAEAKSLAEQVASSEREILEEALKANGFRRTATAKALGISRVGLYKKMKRYGMLDTAGGR